MIVVLLKLFGMGAPNWMKPVVKWAIDIAIVLAILGGLWWLHSRATQSAYNAAYNAGWSVEHARLEKLIADYRTAYERARADNLADVRAKESDAATITEKANHDLESQLADARRLATDYARRMRAAAAGTDQGSAGETRLGEVTSPASHPFSAGGVPLLDENDVRVCTDATVKAQGWQSFYTSLRERYNTDGTP